MFIYRVFIRFIRADIVLCELAKQWLSTCERNQWKSMRITVAEML